MNKDFDSILEIDGEAWFIDKARRTTFALNEEGRRVVIERFGIQNVDLSNLE